MQKQTTMKRSRLFLWILGIIMQAFLVSIHFYQKNVEAMRTESEDLLVEVLKKELHRKQQELNLFYISKVTVDTVPLIIRVTTSEGVKSYAVDAKKSKKNISQNMAERSWHSAVCMKSGLSVDTLHQLWDRGLKRHKIFAKTDVHMSITHLDNTISHFKCKNSNDLCSVTQKITVYIGNRCELEIIGFWSYSWWTVYQYHSTPFEVIGSVAAALIIVFCGWYLVKKYITKIRNDKRHLANDWDRERKVRIQLEKDQKRLEAKQREYEKRIKDLSARGEEYEEERKSMEKILKEYEIQIQKLKELRESGKEPLLYILSPKVTFGSYAKLLICGDQTIPLTSQACRLLDAFLNAPDYILTYEELLECLWKDGSGGMVRLRVAISRLRIVLSVDPEITVFQRDIDKYQLILPEKE